MFDVVFKYIKNARKANLKEVKAIETRYYWCKCPHCHTEGMVEYLNNINKSGIVVECACGEKFVMKSPWR